MTRDERIAFQEKATTFNEYNEPIETWTNIGVDPQMWAEAIPKTGNEDYRGEQKSGFQRYAFNVLHRKDLGIQMRIYWDDRYWDIRSIETYRKKGRNNELLITAEWTQGKYA